MNNSLKKKKSKLIKFSYVLIIGIVVFGLMSCANLNNQPQAGRGPSNEVMVEPDFAAAAIALNISEVEITTAFSELGNTQGPPDFEAIAEKLGVSLEDLLEALGIDNQMQGPGPGTRN